MISAIRELINDPALSLYLLVIAYFWCQWTFKLILCGRYRPKRTHFDEAISVVMPVYNEDRAILFQAVSRVLAQPVSRVAEVIVVCDQREPDLPDWLNQNFASDERMITTVGGTPGKRFSLRHGIEQSRCNVVVSIESDVLIRPDSLDELIKPFADSRIGGVIGDQEVHDPKRSLWTFLDFVCEKVKYGFTYPALSAASQVTVLSGRTVAYRRAAVFPLLEHLTHEIFLGKRCVSGDDGRMTSLLLEAGWLTFYQSTSVVETISPSSMSALLLQRTRWYRNTGRRTLRALFWDRLWVWRRYPLATWHMLSSWVNTFMVGLAFTLLGLSISSGHFFWFGNEYAEIAARVGVLMFGFLLTRMIRGLPAFGAIRRSRPGKHWWLLLALPFYLLMLWFVHLLAIVTMNKQGWITRTTQSPGGLGK